MSEQGQHARRRGWLLGVGLAAVCVASCDEAPTRIVLVIEAEPSVATRLEAIDVTLQREGAVTETDAGHYPLVGSGRVSLAAPDRDGLVALMPRDATDARRVYVTVTGQLLSGAGSVRQVALTRFVREQTTYLHMVLTGSCVSVVCSDRSVCADGRCVAVTERVTSQDPPSPARWDATVGSDTAGDADASSAEEWLPNDTPDVDVAPPRDGALDGDDAFDVVSKLADVEDGSLADRSLELGEEPRPIDAPPLDHSDLGVPEEGFTSDAEAGFSEDSASMDSLEAGDALGGGDAPTDAAQTDVIDASVTGDIVSDALPLPRCPPALEWPGPSVLSTRPLLPRSLSYVQTSRPTLRWSTTEGDPVCVEICRDRACSSVEWYQQVPAGAATAPDRPLIRGPHFWRVLRQIGTTWYRAGPTLEFYVSPTIRETDTCWGTIPDFNGDGRADVFFRRDGAVSPIITCTVVSPGARLGGCASTTDSTTNDLAIRTGDFNGDGFADLAASRGDSVVWYYGSPSGLDRSSTAGDSFRPGGAWYYAGDVNLDGRDELLLAIGTTGTRDLRYLYTDRLPAAMVPPGYGEHAVGGFDLDRNGASDVFVAAPNGRDTDYHMILGNPGVAPTVGPRRFTIAGGLVSLNDLDGDGAQDFASIATSPLRVTWINGSFPSEFWSGRVGSAEMVNYSAFTGGTDLNGDGRMEALIGNGDYGGYTGRVTVLTNTGTGTTTVNINGSEPGGYFGQRVPVLADFNGDGYGDFLVSNNFAASQFQVIFGSATLTPTPLRSEDFIVP